MKGQNRAGDHPLTLRRVSVETTPLQIGGGRVYNAPDPLRVCVGSISFCLAAEDMGPFSCHAEPADGGGLSEYQGSGRFSAPSIFEFQIYT